MSGNFPELKAECESCLEHFKKELGRMRGGKATAGLLEGLTVEYYGAAAPLQQLGLVNAPEARMLTIQVYDAKAVASIEKAILQSDLGLNPSHDGNLIRIVVPALTEERRKELVKAVHRMVEDCKVSLRNHRRDAVEAQKKMQKDKTISEDDLHRNLEGIQKLIDGYTSQLDGLLQAKEKEMMEV